MAILEEANHPEAPFRRQQVQLVAGNLGIPIRVVSTADHHDFDSVFNRAEIDPSNGDDPGWIEPAVCCAVIWEPCDVPMADK
jgi:hypothetical protein